MKNRRYLLFISGNKEVISNPNIELCASNVRMRKRAFRSLSPVENFFGNKVRRSAQKRTDAGFLKVRAEAGSRYSCESDEFR